ncbi:hypothetical protein BDB01DRAFT_137886 [Pilobolus umbonatus]|nr:hypothetical protein BDB01DRAFT_137886 [Pilobolus umbonatus]
MVHMLHTLCAHGRDKIFLLAISSFSCSICSPPYSLIKLASLLNKHHMSTSKDIYPPSFLRKPWSLPDCFPLSRIDNRPENNANDDEGALDNTSFKSEVLTRHIAVYSQRYMADLNVVDLLKSSGDIRAIYPYIASGVTIASYYSLVDAKFALKCIRECHPLFKACYAKSSLIGLTGTETVFISMTSMSGSNLTGFDHMKCLNQYGSIHMLYEMNLSASSKIILIEYHDTRSLKMMQEGLDGNLIKYIRI